MSVFEVVQAIHLLDQRCPGLSQHSLGLRRQLPVNIMLLWIDSSCWLHSSPWATKLKHPQHSWRVQPSGQRKVFSFPFSDLLEWISVLLYFKNQSFSPGVNIVHMICQKNVGGVQGARSKRVVPTWLFTLRIYFKRYFSHPAPYSQLELYWLF